MPFYIHQHLNISQIIHLQREWLSLLQKINLLKIYSILSLRKNQLK